MCLKGYAFYERNTRIGFNSKSRFGLALSGLGDINIDGYGGEIDTWNLYYSVFT